MIRAIILSLLCAVAVGQVPRTPAAGLFVPDHGQPLWSGELSGNFGVIDEAVGGAPKGNFGAIKGITFFVGEGFLADDFYFPGSPGDDVGGQDFDTGDLTTNYFLYQSQPTLFPGDYDEDLIYAGSGPGAQNFVFDGELGFGHNGCCCPGSSDRVHGGFTMATYTATESAADFCGGYDGEWLLGQTHIVGGPLIIHPVPFATLFAQKPCNGTQNIVLGINSQGTWATITDSPTNINGSVITSGGGTHQVAVYCNVTQWVVVGGILAPIGNCAKAGSAANPSVAACGSAQGGVVSCSSSASAGTCTVSTTAVDNNSEIIIRQRTDSAPGNRIGSVTCNTTKDSNATAPQITAVITGTSFSFKLGTISGNPECFDYLLVN